MTASLLLLVNVLAPVVIVAWVAGARAKSRTEAVLVALSGISAVALVWMAGPIWIVIGRIWAPLLAALLAAAILRLAVRATPCPWKPARGWRSRRIVVPAFVLTLFISIVQAVVAGRATPDDPIALDWPLRDGRFVVLQGGNSSLINHHAGVAAQRYALDIVAVNAWGTRAHGLMPADLTRYRIFDMPVHAPCSGDVIAARDGIADAPGALALSRAAGNYTAIFCHEHTVLLAHIKAGTVAVKAGDRVDSGQVIGHVGSSGNSSEPHLHIHAAAGRVDDSVAILTAARGVPMIFDGRFLVRNDLIIR